MFLSRGNNFIIFKNKTKKKIENWKKVKLWLRYKKKHIINKNKRLWKVNDTYREKVKPEVRQKKRGKEKVFPQRFYSSLSHRALGELHAFHILLYEISALKMNQIKKKLDH